MYCTYCHKEVEQPHRCETRVYPTAHTAYVSAHREVNVQGSVVKTFDSGHSTIQNPKD